MNPDAGDVGSGGNGGNGSPDLALEQFTAGTPGHRQLFGMAYRMLGSVHDAEDALQEGFRRWQELTPEQRSLILAAYLNGESREELAKRLGHPTGTIKSWLHRGLARLRGCLDG